MFTFLYLQSGTVYTQEKTIKIGLIASLSGFAAPYGKAVLDGIEVALSQSTNKNISLIVEDDMSQPRGAISAYKKLKDIDKIDGLIGGSWWVNSIVKITEQDSMPFISCETLYDKDFIKAPNYFSLAGDLRDWIKAFSPLIDHKKWQKAVMIKFNSGFSDTLELELKQIFSKDKKTFLDSIEYSDIQMTGAATLALRAISKKPDVIFVDAQPESFAIFVKELKKIKFKDISILTHSVAEDAVKNNLLSPFDINEFVFFLRRNTYDQGFTREFTKTKGVEPYLNADLGYYAAHLLSKALKQENPIDSLKAGVEINSLKFNFDENNISNFIKQIVYTYKDSEIVKSVN